jgi:hypothetical protein
LRQRLLFLILLGICLIPAGMGVFGTSSKDLKVGQPDVFIEESRVETLVTTTTTTTTLSPEREWILVAEFTTAVDVFITAITPTTTVAPRPVYTPAPVQFNGTVEDWRVHVVAAIAKYGGPASDVERFLRVMQCESGGNPQAKNLNSSASGLMQHLARYWDGRAVGAGYPGGNIFDGVTNINVSAWLIYQAVGGGWNHWVCR